MQVNKVEMRFCIDHVDMEVLLLILIRCEELAPVGRYHSQVALGSLML